MPATAKKSAARPGAGQRWLILLLVIAASALCSQLVSKQYNHQLRSVVLRHLRELFPNATVEVGHVHQDSAGRLIVSNVVLRDRESRPRRAIFAAQRVALEGNLQISDWASDQLALKHIDLYGVQFDVWPIEGERWSVETIVPRPKTDTCPPEIELHDALVCIHQAATMNAPEVTLQGVSGTVYTQLLATAAALSSGVGTEKIINARLSGRSPGTLDRFEVEAVVAPHSQTWRATGEVMQLQLTEALRDRLPTKLTDYLSQLAGLQCEVSAAFAVSADAAQSPRFKVKGKLESGRFQDPRLPYPLENLRSEFTCDNSQMQLRNASAESGSARIFLDTDIYGLGLQGPMNNPMLVVVRFQDLALDHRLYQSLPEKLREQWDKLELSGRVSGRLRLNYDGQRWTPTAVVQCQDVQLKPWLFPYPIEEVQGLVSFENEQLLCNGLVGKAEGQTLVGQFDLTRLGQDWVGQLSCRAEGPVSIDELLLAALTPRDRSPTGAEQFVRSLHPTGTVLLRHASFWRDAPGEAWHKEIDANVFNGSIRYDKFAYPIYDIRGRLVAQDDAWWLDKFEGRNDSGRIQCSGNWQIIPGQHVPLHLNFEALSVPIEEELKGALPTEAQFVWDELQPLGSIDRVTISLQRSAEDPQVRTSVSVAEDSTSNAATGRSLRLRPKAFPYWLNDVDCRIRYEPGQVVIEKASGVNGSSEIALKGSCTPTQNGRWKASVEWLPKTRLLVESELLKALPKSIRESLVKLDFRGPLSVLGHSQIEFADSRNSDVTTSWSCQVAVEDGQLGDGRHIGALRGTLFINGHSRGNQLTANGSIAMDALAVLGVPVMQLTGPFAIRGSSLYFGTHAYELFAKTADMPQRMTANALSGQLSLSGYGRLDSGNFHLDSELQGADLKLLLRDLGVATTDTEAKCNAELSFDGVPWNPQTYDGRGQVHLTEAQLYELPFMIRLMNVASVTATNDSAFQTADITFELDGDHIPLEVACYGDVLRLKGSGWTNLRRQLNLELYSYVGRRFPGQSVVSPLLAESKYATFMLIEVDGSLDSPNMRRRPFPQIEATWQQIFPEVADSNSSPSLLPWQRR